MKGRKLSLNEVLNLEDGCKVWVEDNRKMFNDELCEYNSYSLYLELVRNNSHHYNLNYIEAYENKLTFYEWIDESEIPYPNNMQQTITNLATEICNLRSLYLTDENIEMIIREFS